MSFQDRRGGRVVECSGLENRRTGNRSVSSNLTHAAVATSNSLAMPPSPQELLGTPNLWRAGLEPGLPVYAKPPPFAAERCCHLGVHLNFAIHSHRHPTLWHAEPPAGISHRH
jgi:hypothetical protein